MYIASVSTASHQHISTYDQNYIIASVSIISLFNSLCYHDSHYFINMFYHYYLTIAYLATVPRASHQRISTYDQNCIISSVSHYYLNICHYCFTISLNIVSLFFSLLSHNYVSRNCLKSIPPAHLNI